MHSTQVCEKGTPLVSVMMPAYNCEKYVGEAIESIINQTYTNWELICVDDGSTDRTLEIMQEYAAKDSGIRVYANEENRGRPYTRNRILELARGEILAVQDGDDVSLSHRLEEGVKILASDPDIAILGSGMIGIDEEGDEVGVRYTPPLLSEGLNDIIASQRLPFAGPTALMRAAAVRAVGGYDEFFLLAQDYDLFVRLASDGHRFAAVPNPWYLFRRHSQQGSTTSRGTQHLYQIIAYKRAQAARRGVAFDSEAEFNHLKAQSRWASSLRRARQLYSLGIDSIVLGKVTAARKHFGEALRYRPLFPRALFGYVLTLMPARARTWLMPGAWRRPDRCGQRQR